MSGWYGSSSMADITSIPAGTRIADRDDVLHWENGKSCRRVLPKRTMVVIRIDKVL